MISKLGNFEDPLIDAQIGEIVSNQFSNYKEVTVTFTATNTTTKVDVGFLADRFIIIDQTADMRIWRMSSDSRYMYLQASRAGSVTLKVWKSDQISTADAVGTAGTGAGSGDVVGPASAVNNNFVSFDGTTGKLIKDSGSKVADFATAGANINITSLAGLTTPLTVPQGGTGLSTLTQGYIPFGQGASALGLDANLFWDNTNKKLHVVGTGYFNSMNLYGTIAFRTTDYTIHKDLGWGTYPEDPADTGGVNYLQTLIRVHKYGSDLSLHRHLSFYTTGSNFMTSFKRLDLPYGQDYPEITWAGMRVMTLRRYVETAYDRFFFNFDPTGDGVTLYPSFQMLDFETEGVSTPFTYAYIDFNRPDLIISTGTNYAGRSEIIRFNTTEVRINTALGIGASPNTSAILDVVSTTKAFMPPRMITTERDAIANPAAGMVIYNTTTGVLNFHNGTAWSAV